MYNSKDKLIEQENDFLNCYLFCLDPKHIHILDQNYKTLVLKIQSSISY